MRGSAIAVLAVLAAGLGACSNVPRVEAWEKGDLAREAMTLEGDRLERRAAQHVYESKEGSSGGYGVGGGGCGCN
jgi:hypothetical protein